MATPDNLPRPAPDVLTDGVPATEELPGDQLLTGDPVEGEVPPLDHAQGAESWGTTAEEQRGGEPVGLRARREQPEAGPGEAGPAGLAGLQLTGPGSGADDTGFSDDEAEEVGETNLAFEDTVAPEEAAMRVEEAPGGLTDGDDPGYVDAEEGRRP